MNAPDPFETIVSEQYQPLFRFAWSLTRSESDAWDLTQQTFHIWTSKGHQLRDRSKIRTWLFTTLHRAFLAARRRKTRFTDQPLDEASAEVPSFAPNVAEQADFAEVLLALSGIDEIYQAAVALFYLEDCSYQDIASILGVPIGTVKSRLSRGIGQLREILLGGRHNPEGWLGRAGLKSQSQERNHSALPVSKQCPLPCVVAALNQEIGSIK